MARTLVIKIAEAAAVIVPIYERYGPIQKECEETAVCSSVANDIIIV